MNTLQERLQEVFPPPMARGVMAEIARLCEVSRPTVSAWFANPEKVQTISRSNAEKICKNFSLLVSPAWLAENLGPKYLSEAAANSPATVPAQYSASTPPEEGYVRLPVMAEAGAGNGCESLPEVVSYIDVLESYVRRQLGANPRTIKVLTARGNSMTGQIEDGDIMFVEQTSEFTDDGIYILTLDNLVRVKRLSVSALSQQVIIESNDGRKAEELPLKDVPHRLHIQGRVVGAWSLRRFS